MEPNYPHLYWEGTHYMALMVGNGEAEVWDLRQASATPPLAPKVLPGSWGLFGNHGRHWVTSNASEKKDIMLWELWGSEFRTLCGHPGMVSHCASDPKLTDFLLSCDTKPQLRLWKPSCGSCLITVELAEPCACLAMCGFVAIVGTRGAVELVSTNKYQVVSLSTRQASPFLGELWDMGITAWHANKDTLVAASWFFSPTVWMVTPSQL
eukprot:TRINITY_DN26881_c0_g1_i1.p1 TRINITY_DN26881_c0_g1~~TRINITY_DN26881_c0_g1_i1.p1  ORF type:complete len:209 (-),score=22.82 TRINITY_DN26881_c0_g1_i1:26-652(-)